VTTTQPGAPGPALRLRPRGQHAAQRRGGALREEVPAGVDVHRQHVAARMQQCLKDRHAAVTASRSGAGRSSNTCAGRAGAAHQRVPPLMRIFLPASALRSSTVTCQGASRQER